MTYKYIELRDNDLLKAVVDGTESNAHLVATATLAQGVEATVEQYQLPTEKVLSAIKFYLDNQEEIERLSEKAWNDPRILRGDARREEMAERKEALRQQKAIKESMD